jgi:hypothetical protein
MLPIFRKALLACVLVAVQFLFSCKREQAVCTDCIHDIYVPLLEDDITEYPMVSRLFTSIDTIYLENPSPDSYVQSVDEVKFTGDTIIVRSSSSLFFFDRQGHFLKRFSRQGNGFGNYRVIERFDLLPDRKELFVLDDQSNKVFVYGLDGEYRRQVSLYDFVTDFAVLPDGGFLFVNPIRYDGKNNRRGLWKTDSEGNFLKQVVEFDPEFAHVSINNPYINHISPGVIGFMGIEDNDKFYHYADDSVSVTCRMVTDIVIPDELKRSDKVFINPEREYTKCGYLETPRYLYFVNTNYGANLMMTFTDKTTWKTYRMYVYTGEFNRDKLTREPFPFLVSSYNGTLVGFYDSGMITESERFSALFPTITADSNPVLLFFREN